MKKWLYVVSAFILGVFVATSIDSVYAQVKSLVGQKVTGEYTVIINGQKLEDKGAVISGRTSAPVRALSESLGADLKVDNSKKVIEITTENITDEVDNTSAEKEKLLQQKTKLEHGLSILIKDRDETQAKYDQLSIIPKTGEKEGGAVLMQAINAYNKSIEEKQNELAQVNEALKAFE
ncbi:stalk domain-containing protein [Paenibacillus sp. BR1-192]|uniref:stalk domain-containing protein n=1 Tax=Paenibacillus sp. BR1-192 TaxID=3032287 RepID=UPI00240D5DA1|nr:stalk domain-containing protein [Paenibacillus sp. BR1-192]WFB57466.1 stalk domain-containing protein [Paenibacillus sp. BR1-192]